MWVLAYFWVSLILMSCKCREWISCRLSVDQVWTVWTQLRKVEGVWHPLNGHIQVDKLLSDFVSTFYITLSSIAQSPIKQSRIIELETAKLTYRTHLLDNDLLFVNSFLQSIHQYSCVFSFRLSIKTDMDSAIITDSSLNMVVWQLKGWMDRGEGIVSNGEISVLYPRPHTMKHFSIIFKF